MDYKTKLNFDRICRVCLIENNQLVNIFLPNSNSGFNVLQAINICCELKPSVDDGLPKHLCNDCEMLANTVLFFKQKCEEADNKMKEYLMNESASRDPLGLMGLGDYGDYFQYDNTTTEPLFPSNVPIDCQTKQPTAKDVINTEYTCYMCQTVHKSCKDLVNHVIASHSQQINPLPNHVTCALCSKKFISEFECSKHISIQHTELFITNDIISCPFCGELFNKNDTLQKHIETHAELSYNKCEKCDCYFTKNVYLTNHNKILHPEDSKDDKDATMDSDILKTSIGLMDDSYSFLNNELDIGEDDLIPSIVESNLNSSFMNQAVDSSQCITDFDANKILSEVLECAPPMGSFTSFKNKKANDDEDIPKDDEDIPKDDQDIPKDDQSPEDIFAKPGRRKRKAYGQSTPKRKKYEYSFPCSQCEKTFTREGSLKNHEAMHRREKTLMCTECGQLFGQASTLNKHIARKHSVTGPKPKFSCTSCSKEFTQLNYLKCHLKSHNINVESSKKEKTHLCTLCGKTFGSSSNLYVHIRQHTGEMTNFCTICGKGYPRSTDLKLHMRRHTGDKPYKCDVCNAAFFRSDNLRVHTRLHTGERPYTCTNCNKSFKYPSDLITHRKKETCKRKMINAKNMVLENKPMKNGDPQNEIEKANKPAENMGDLQNASNQIHTINLDNISNGSVHVQNESNKTITNFNGAIYIQNGSYDAQKGSKSNGTVQTQSNVTNTKSLLKTSKMVKMKVNSKQTLYLDDKLQNTTNNIIHLKSLNKYIVVNASRDNKSEENNDSN